MSVSINLQIEGGENLGPGLMRFDPGGRLRCQVQLMPEKNIKTRNTTLWVQWHTEGRGDKDIGKGNIITVAEGDLANGMPIYQSYDLILPTQPWSYAGHYIQIIWSVQLKIDIPWGNDYTAGVQFVLLPSATGVTNPTDPFQATPAQSASTNALDEIGDFGF